MRLIDADVLLENIQSIYCKPCEERGDDYDHIQCRACSHKDVIDDIKDTPAVDELSIVISSRGNGKTDKILNAVRPKGYWKWIEEWTPSTTDSPAECQDYGWVCSECREHPLDDEYLDIEEEPTFKFCPNCGSDMRGGK